MNSEMLALIKTMLETSDGKGVSPETINIIMMIINLYTQSSKKDANTYVTKKELYEMFNEHFKFLMKTFPERISDLPLKSLEEE